MTEPAFIPKEGQVNYTNVRWCPVINCVVQYEGCVLLVQRAPTMRLYPGYWNGISGFIDDAKSLEEKVYEELHEELGLDREVIQSIELRGVFLQEAPEIQKTWIVHAVSVTVSSKDITLDWEAQGYAWVSYPITNDRPLLPGFDTVLALVMEQPNRVNHLTS